MVSKNTMSLAATFFIEFHYGCVPFATPFLRGLVAIRIVVAECIVRACTSLDGVPLSEESFHIGWIEDNAIEGRVFVRQIPAINPIGDI